MNKTDSIPDIVIPKYAQQVRTIEQALQEHEKGTQLVSGFSPFAAFYLDLVDKTVQIGRAIAGKGVSPQTVRAHSELSEKLRSLAKRVTKAFAEVAPSELQDALRKDDATLVCKILKHKDLLNKNLPNGEQPLALAIRSGSRQVVERLFKEFPIDTSFRDRQKLTPIDHALLTKDDKMIALVLGAAIGKQAIPESALSRPVQNSDLQTIAAEKDLLRRVPAASLPPLCQHAYLGELGPLNDLIAKGADLNATSGASGMTPLHYAALGGQTAAFELLLKKGAKAGGLALNGKSALHLAAMNGHTAIIKLLLARPEIQVNGTDSDGKTALHYAVVLENLDTARILVQKGANPLIETLKTTPFAILVHLAKGRANLRDPMKFELSTLLTSAAYGSAIGLHYAAESALPVGTEADAIQRIISPASNPSATAFYTHNLGEFASAAPAVWNAPTTSFLPRMATLIFWGGLFSFAPLRAPIQAWNLLMVGKNAFYGLATAWKNRHLETFRPLANAGLHVFNTMSAAAGLIWSLRFETSAAYDQRWALIGEELSMHKVLNSEKWRQATEEWLETEKDAFGSGESPDVQRNLLRTKVEEFNQGKAVINMGKCPTLKAADCGEIQGEKERQKCEKYVKAPEILGLSGPRDPQCNANYRKLALKCHTDKIQENPNACKYSFVEIGTAHDILKEFGCCGGLKTET